MLDLHLRQYANCQRAIDKTKYQLQLGAILIFKCHCIRMQLVVMLSAQRQHKEIMCFCSHSALPVTNQMMRIVGWHTAASTRLCLNPTCVFLLNPAASFSQLPERFRRLWINSAAYHRLFLWCFLLLVGLSQRSRLLTALCLYAGGGLLSPYDVAFAVHRADFFRW